MNNKKYLLLKFLISLSIPAFSQTEPKFIPIKSPEAYSFGKNIETPVSYYSGRPSISIPIYNINIGDDVIPIVVSYNTGGIRINERATIVGLGWNLELGGQITRRKRGLTDESGFYTSNSVAAFRSLPSVVADPYLTTRSSYVWDAKYGINGRDFMPDEFYFSAVGYSGKYLFSQKTGKFVLFPKEDIEVVRGSSPAWTLKLPNGNRALFTGNGAVTERVTGSSDPASNAWNISHLITPKNDSVNFSYESYSYVLSEQGREVRMYGVGSAYELSYNESTFSDKRIQRIDFPAGQMTFTYISRDDLPTKALDKIVVTNSMGETVKEVKFYYSYFQCSNHYTSANVFFTTYAVKRLKLDSVSVKSSITGDAPQMYRFTYYEESSMPSRFSYSEDYWGYHNGVSNPSLIPNIDPNKFTGANKKVNLERAKVFSLKTIQYPEGVVREFVYEGNTSVTNYIPSELLALYDDSNFIEKSASISFSGYDRTYFSPAPDSISSLQEKIYKRTFEVSAGALSYLGKGFDVTTDFGQSQLDKLLSCEACRADFYLYRVNTNNTRTLVASFSAVDCINNTRVGAYSRAVDISPGQYQMEVKILYRANTTEYINQRHSTNFIVKWRERDVTNTIVNIGGLRIKEIKDYDKNSLVRHRRFVYGNGRVVSFPQYYRNLLSVKNGGYYGIGFYSNSIIPLETTSGSYVGYDQVTEEEVGIGSMQSLKTKYTFSYKNPLFSQYYGNYSLAMLEPKEWERGNLLRKEVYRGDSIIYSEQNEYYFYSPHLAGDSYEESVEEINTDFISFNILGDSPDVMPIDFIDIVGALNTLGYHYGVDNYQVNGMNPPSNWTGGSGGVYNVSLPYFERQTGFSKLMSSTVTRYDGGETSTKVVTYYDNTSRHYQPTRTSVTKSDGSTELTLTTYPDDYADGTGFIDDMKISSGHLVSYPIERVRYKEEDANRSILSGRITKYLPTGKGLIDQIMELETATPIMLSSFKFSNGNQGELPIGSIPTSFLPYPFYKTKLIYGNYDAYGNPQEIKRTDGAATTYLWSYRGLYPVAEIRNATFAEVQTVLGGSSVVNALSTSFPTDVFLKNKFEPLRNALSHALLSYFTYRPLLGMNGATDPTGNTLYYSYDGFGRLKDIKNTKNEIVKTYQYHFGP